MLRGVKVFYLIDNMLGKCTLPSPAISRYNKKLHDQIVRFQPLFLKLILYISVEYFRSPRILFKNCHFVSIQGKGKGLPVVDQLRYERENRLRAVLDTSQFRHFFRHTKFSCWRKNPPNSILHLVVI